MRIDDLSWKIRHNEATAEEIKEYNNLVRLETAKKVNDANRIAHEYGLKLEY